MKKGLSLILCLMLMLSATAPFSLHTCAETGAIILPEFAYPATSHASLSTTGIPYNDVWECFPKEAEVKYENGVLRLRDLGGDGALFVSGLDFGTRMGKRADGYWTFKISPEEYAAGGNLSIYTNCGYEYPPAWEVNYLINGKCTGITLTKYEGCLLRSISLYSADSFGGPLERIVYDLSGDLQVTDTYKEGALQGQTVELRRDEVSARAEYDAHGDVRMFTVRRYDTGESASFIPGKGWSDNRTGYVPVEAPTGFENATLESLTALVPTDIGCAHEWEMSLCDVPSICSLCKRQKGEPLGHHWVAGEAYDTCSVCSGILYRVCVIGMPTFERCPQRYLEETGTDVDALSAGCIPKILTEYENGILAIPCIEGGFLRVKTPDGSYIDYETNQGRNRMKAAKEDLEKLQIFFSSEATVGDHLIKYTYEYTHEGNLVSLKLYAPELQQTVSMLFEENIVELSYSDTEGKTEYTDVYVDGKFVAQTVTDPIEETRVFYDSDLKVEKVRIFLDGIPFWFIPEKGWMLQGEETMLDSPPKGYEDKGVTYFASTYPHTADFRPDWVIVSAVVCKVLAIAVVAVVAIVLKRKKARPNT